MQDIKLRQTFSILAVLFFAFFVQFFLLKDDSYNLTQEDKDFVKSYILPGYLVIVIVVLYFILNLINFFLLTDFIHQVVAFISNILIFLDLVFVLYLLYMILNDKKFRWKLSLDLSSDISSNIGGLIPFYNFYLLYKESKSTYFIKESILFNFLIILFYFISPVFSFLIFLIYILRIITIYFGVNIFPKQLEDFINSLYNFNIEEIYSYIVALIERLYFNFIKKVSRSYNDIVYKYKNWYSKIYDINKMKEDNILLISWVLYGIFVLFVLVIIIDSVTYNNIYGYFIMGLILFRYLIMFYYKKINYIPIFTEIVSNIIHLINKKSSNEKVETDDSKNIDSTGK